MRFLFIGAAVLATLTLTPAIAQANDRHFTYTYETATLPAGALELEMWTTARTGRLSRFTRFDNRFELEMGLTDSLQTAFYLNTNAVVQGYGDQTEAAYTFEGVSNEWKLRLSDPLADALGTGLYGEWAFGPDELELEVKLLLDKRLGPVFVAANLIFELEIEHLGDENETERVFEVDLAGAYFITPKISLGLEARAHGAHKDELEPVAFFAGPVASWAWSRSWAAFTVMTQLGAVGGDMTGFKRDLEEHEALNARLLWGSDF